MSKYFKSSAGDVHFFDGEIEGIEVLGLTLMTEEEVSAHIGTTSLVSASGLKEMVTRYRWTIETGGITLPGGVKVATALDDQNRISGVVSNARLAGIEEVSFKAATGWVTLSLAEVEGIAAAMARHVQACFSAERAHHEAIDYLAQIEDAEERQAALDDYDVSQGWPQ